MKQRSNDNKVFGDVSKISKKFWRIEKFLVNIGHILKKCKGKKNLRNIQKNWENFCKFVRMDFKEI